MSTPPQRTIVLKDTAVRRLTLGNKALVDYDGPDGPDFIPFRTLYLDGRPVTLGGRFVTLGA